MNLDLIKSKLAKEGWKDIQPGNHMGIEFDLVGFRRYLLAKCNVLVKILPELDQMQAEQWKNNFQTINNNSLKFIRGKFFLIVLLAGTVSDKITGALVADPVDMVGGWKFRFFKRGGGNVFVVDLVRQKIYGFVPTSSKSMYYLSKGLQTNLMEAIDGSAVHPAPSGPCEIDCDLDSPVSSMSD
jgi:hypothetical protein